VKAPLLFGRRMRAAKRGDGYWLAHAGLLLSIKPFRYGVYGNRWMFSVSPASTLPLSGSLMGDETSDSAESAAAQLELLLTNLTIALATSGAPAKRQVAKKKPRRTKRAKPRRKARKA
jgi:hypothetical protein